MWFHLHEELLSPEAPGAAAHTPTPDNLEMLSRSSTGNGDRFPVTCIRL